MGFSRVLIVGLTSVLLTGCGYVHFGRAPKLANASDAKLATAYSELTTEQKILRHELALARKESDSLRAALERTGSTTRVNPDTRLADVTSELADLRTQNARLQAERSSVSNLTIPADAAKQITEFEAKLSAAAVANESLQAEVTRLRNDLDRVRAENVALNDQLRQTLQRQEETHTLLAAREAELATVAQARHQAEQLAEAARGQLQDALRASANARSPAPANAAPTPRAPAASPLQMAKSPPAGAVTGDTRGQFQVVEALPSATPAKARVHVVQRGDTLEKLSRDYYGVPDQWHRIYEANMAELSTGRPLQPGMELSIPEKSP